MTDIASTKATKEVPTDSWQTLSLAGGVLSLMTFIFRSRPSS